MHNVSKWSGKFFAQRHVCNESRNIKSVEQVNKRREAKRQTGADRQAENRAEQVNVRRQLESQIDAVVVFVDDKRTRGKKRKKQRTKEEREKVQVRVQKFRENLTKTAREKIQAHDKEYRRKRKKMKIDKSNQYCPPGSSEHNENGGLTIHEHAEGAKS